MNAERLPEYDLATPNTVDNLLNDPLAQKGFGLRYRGDL